MKQKNRSVPLMTFKLLSIIFVTAVISGIVFEILSESYKLLSVGVGWIGGIIYAREVYK